MDFVLIIATRVHFTNSEFNDAKGEMVRDLELQRPLFPALYYFLFKVKITVKLSL